MLELIALPLPGEILMSYAGFLVYQGHLNWMISILAAGIGSCTGMTIAYIIGYKLGTPFIEKHGHRVHLGPDRLEKTSQWFSKYGNKMLIFSYFIPGVRHITGYFSGITRLSFRTYMLFAYSGAFIWTFIFITIGKLLGPQWDQFHNSVKKYLLIGLSMAVVVLIAVYFYRKYKQLLKEKTIFMLKKVTTLFKSSGVALLFIVFTLMATLSLIILMIDLIQDFLGNEMNDFNEITTLLVSSFFEEQWTLVLKVFLVAKSVPALIVVIILTLLWILWRDKLKLYGVLSLAIVVFGGELYEESLRRFFHRLAPDHLSFIEPLTNSFPSEQSLMAIVIYGFFLYLFVRYSHNGWYRIFAIVGVIVILVLMAIAQINFNAKLPSDIVAGFVFGGVWLGLNIILLEIFYLFNSVKHAAEDG
ncbi:VTT domain-containing protein [Bacillus sp. FJAT-49731]|uniref:VTT domain-containing protein n=2 Tax=Lederbergia citrea TaxID=2833581 RepID=A0A942URI7_9BACI|nr:VTT domain-containing protein [Lederbergia citrea]MBS4177844.1 VTT domain-containing protein [Lederbergia citrea]MBS4204518.1 VTT domain-containing protein [Lederbergia citrea]MBS4223638.1 VTT domain-containing protein [Lederbergia citrea]